MSNLAAGMMAGCALALLISCAACDRSTPEPPPTSTGPTSTPTPTETVSAASAQASAQAAPLPSAPPPVGCAAGERPACEKDCKADVGSACRRLARLNARDHVGKEGDWAKLNEKGCELGDGEGCYMAAHFYLRGSGVKKDEDKARVMIEKSAVLFDDECKQGIGYSCQRLALLYQKGQGVEQNQEKASELYAKACKSGVKLACRHGKKPPAK